VNGSISRRDFLKVVKTIIFDTFLLGVGGSIYSTLIEPLWFDVIQISITLSRLPKAFSGFRILQISDIHAGEQFMPAHLGEVVGKIRELKPDIILITGDFVYSSPLMTDEILDTTAGLLAQLSASMPVFAVMGNHDHWWDVSRVRSMLQRANVKELANDFFTIQKDDDMLHICGVDDFYVRESKLEPILSRLPEVGCAILMAHEPDFADKSAVSGRFDLQVSGHSHGGQVVIPFLGPLVLPNYGRKYPSGFYKIGQMVQYTNRGLGMVFPYVRFLCRPEITVFTLNSAD
jgi:predicted MPP superfamily phosphohydrolase